MAHEKPALFFAALVPAGVRSIVEGGLPRGRFVLRDDDARRRCGCDRLGRRCVERRVSPVHDDPGFAITPVVQARFIPGEDIKSALALFGVELGWWSGLPRNQLELPDSEAYRPR